MTENRIDTRRKTENRAKCPICGKPPSREYRPFCSRRCADIDLGRWLSERYTMPLPDSEANGDPDEPDR